MVPPLGENDFTALESLNLSYNKISAESIRNLYQCVNLKQLDLAANNLEQLPDDMFNFENLEDLEVKPILTTKTDNVVWAIFPEFGNKKPEEAEPVEE